MTHQDRAAVGICKSCYKGLCPDCAADLGHGLACKGKHEAAVEALNGLIERNLRILAMQGRAKYTMPIFFAAMGCLFIAMGWREGARLSSPVELMGLLFIALGLWFLVVNRKARV